MSAKHADKGHSLLRRQLRRHLGSNPVPPDMAGFVDAVEDAYRQFDADRGMLERSLELSSQELIQATAEMRAIFRALPDLIFNVASDGTIVRCHAGNPSDIDGRSADLVGKQLGAIPVEDVAAKLREALAAVRRERSLVTTEYA